MKQHLFLNGEKLLKKKIKIILDDFNNLLRNIIYDDLITCQLKCCQLMSESKFGF